MTVRLNTHAEMLELLNRVAAQINKDDPEQSRADFLARLTAIDPISPGFFGLQKAIVESAKNKSELFCDAFILGAAAADAYLRSKGLIQ